MVVNRMQGWFTASALIFCVGLALVIPRSHSIARVHNNMFDIGGYGVCDANGGWTVLVDSLLCR